MYDGPLGENFPKLVFDYSCLHFVYMIDLDCPFRYGKQVNSSLEYGKYLTREIEIDGFNV